MEYATIAYNNNKMRIQIKSGRPSKKEPEWRLTVLNKKEMEFW
jgi:hypothetical protein